MESQPGGNLLQPADNIFLSRIYSTWIILWWLDAFFNHSLLHFTHAVVFMATDIEPLFAVLNYFGILKVLVQSIFFRNVIDFSILFFAVLFLLKPLKGYFSLALLFFLSLFDLCFATLVFQHSHGFYGLLILALPLCFIGKTKIFPLVWSAARYIPIFTYTVAFYWKIKGGSFSHPLQALAVIESNLSFLLVNDSGSVYARFIAFFVRHPQLLQVIYTGGLLCEALFVIGIFTRKFDVYLIIGAICLHISIIVFVDAYFIAHCIFLLPLLPVQKCRNTFLYRLMTRKLGSINFFR